MIVFGAPVELENPSMLAVTAANELLTALDDAVNSGLLDETNIGIGIHTGEVVTGNIGTADRHQYSITGNVVILAARIEQLNKQFDSKLLVSEDVAHAIKIKANDSTCFKSVDVKGWLKPISIYKLA
jgi:adenylate cyclase